MALETTVGAVRGLESGQGATVLVVEDHEPIWDVVRLACRGEGWTLRFVPSGEEAVNVVAERGADLDALLVDIRLPGMSGIEVLRSAHAADPALPIVMLTALGDTETVVTCMKCGAHDYLTKPFRNEQLADRLRRAVRTRSLLRPARGRPPDDYLAEIMGPSPATGRLAQLVALVSPTEMSVLVTGESGTGKEILARRIHALSLRRDGPFVAVDCGAIPETLFESELFGSTKGSFTGSVANREGRFQAAHGGTLFLDEVGNLSLGMQAKLLRALQEREVTPIGRAAPVPVDVRVICATNAALEAEIDRGGFRLDLFGRLAEFPLQVAPLRERIDDLVYLAHRFLQEAGREFGKEAVALGDEAMAELLAHPWPGNVRELRSVVRRATLLAAGRIEHLLSHAPARREAARVSATQAQGTTVISAEAIIRGDALRAGRVSFKQIRDRLVQEVERGLLTTALAELGGNLSQAARLLGVDYKTVQGKVKAFGILRRASCGQVAEQGSGG